MMKLFTGFLILTVAAIAEGQGISKGDRLDILIAYGDPIKAAKILEIGADYLVIINADGVQTVKKATLAQQFSAKIDWPLAPVVPVKTKEPETKPTAQIALAQIFGSQPKASGGEKADDEEKPVSGGVYVPNVPKPTIEPDLSPLVPFEGEPASTLLATKIHGQCFIVTKGGTNFKLGDVTISVYPKALYGHYTDQIAKRYSAFVKAWEPYKKDREMFKDYDETIAAIQRGLDYHENLRSLMPRAPYFTSTDADGKYELEHKIAKPYVIVARAQRAVGDEVEKYLWEINSDEIPDNGQLMLTNRNLN